MLLKFFTVTGEHHEPGGLDYLLENETARVVRGDTDLTKWVIDQSPPGLRQRFTSGVINDLSKLNRRHDKKLLDELQKMFLAGRPESSMVWCVIEHTDKGKRELHFVVAIYDLLFGKFCHPYVDRIDQHGFAAWVEHFAIRHDLEFPLDKLRKKPPFKHMRLKKTEIRFLREVWVKVHLLVRKKVIKSRMDLESQLALSGYQVRCQSYDGKPLEQPEIIGPVEVKLRLKNSIYYRSDFGDPAFKPLDRSDPEAVRKRLAELRSIIRARMDFRAHHLIGRLFGLGEKRLTPKGKARLRIKELIDKKLTCEIEADRPWCKVDLATVWMAAELFRSGVPHEILDPTEKVGSKTKPTNQPAGAEKSIPTISPMVSSNHETAQAEAFLPPPSGGTTDIEGPAQRASPINAPTSGGRVRKQRRINQEIDLPPL